MFRKTSVKLALAAFILSLSATVYSSEAYAQLPAADYFGQTVQTIYTALGGVVPQGVDLATGLNYLFYLVFPFILIVAILYDVFSSMKLFKHSFVRGLVAVIIAILLIPAQAFTIIVFWLYTAGGAVVLLLFFALFMLGISRYARERVHELGYTGVFSKKSFLYGTATLGWGTIFGVVGFYMFGGGGGFLGFFVGAAIGAILALIETKRAKIAPQVAEIEKKLFERLEDVRKQIGILAKERGGLQAQLQKLLDQGKTASDSEIVALQRQMDAVDEQIKSLRLQMEKEREVAETEIIRRRVQASQSL